MKGRQSATRVSADFPNPSNYTPTPVNNEWHDRVSAHLKGIDVALGDGLGTTGPIGPQGVVGLRGFQGFDGFEGFQGFTGYQGLAGEYAGQGVQGKDGPQGIAGSSGVNGATGPTGPEGASVYRGYQGFQGPEGAKPAIVKIQNKWLGLYCAEAPQVWFFDIVEAQCSRNSFEIEIDSKFIEACEPNTLKVTSVISDDTGLGYSRVWIENNTIRLDMDENLPVDKFALRVTVYGIRKGFTQRFAEYTEEQATRNNNFWSGLTQ
jgi:hypothetical protein